MTVLRHRRATALMVFMTCGLVTGAASAGAESGRTGALAEAALAARSVASSGAVQLSIPRPTGPHPVGVRSAFVHDPTRTDPATGKPRALPVRVWYPAERRHGPSAPYTSAPIQSAIEQFLGVPPGLFDIDTHAVADAPARRPLRGVLLVSPALGFVVAFNTGLITEIASHGYALVAFDHPHETFAVDQPDGSVITGDLTDLDAAFQARLLDVGVVLGALGGLVPETRRHTPIGMFGHSFGGSTAGEAMRLHPEIRAGVNLDGAIRGDVLSQGLDRPFGLMLSLEVLPQEQLDIARFLSNMRAPHPVRSLEIRHIGYSDFVVFNPQAHRADPAIGTILDSTFATGTLDSLRAGHRALQRQREFLVRFFDRYLESERGSDARVARSPPARHRAGGGQP